MPFNLSNDIQYLELPDDDYTSGYLQSIHYTDKVFGEFYSKLEEHGYLDNSIIVIYGDHEGVHKYYDTSLPDNNKKIPFIIHNPEMKSIVINTIGGQVDIMPTLAYLLGIESEKYSNSVMGKNLFSRYPGSVLLQTGDILGDTIHQEHLKFADTIADKIIRGNYFNIK